VRKLDGLPLALTTAGAFLSQVPESFAEYLQAYENSFAALHENAEELLDYPGRTLYTTWLVSFNLVQAQDPDAARLLQLLAYFDNHNIWYGLLLAGIRDRPSSLGDVIADKFRFRSSMTKLCNYSLVEQRPDHKGYCLHTCIHDWTLDGLNRTPDPELYSIAFLSVARSVADDRQAWNWIINRPLVPHAVRLQYLINWALGKLPGQFELDETPNFLAMGYLFKNQQMFQHSEMIHQRLLVGQKRKLGLTHTSTLRTAAQLAKVYLGQRRLDQAFSLLRRVVKAKTKTPGHEHEQLKFEAIHDLAKICQGWGYRADADRAYRKAFSGLEELLGPENHYLFDILRDMAGLFEEQDAVGWAAQMLKQALAGLENQLGATHPKTLDTFDDLASVYVKMARFAEAEQMFRKSMQGREELLGPNHVSTLATIIRLGALYDRQGKLTLAVQTFRRALEGQGTVSMEHENYYGIMNNLAIIYKRQHKLQEAEELLWKAYAGCEKLSTPEHPTKLQILANLSDVLAKRGFHEKSKFVLSQMPPRAREELANTRTGTRLRLRFPSPMILLTRLAVTAVTGGNVVAGVAASYMLNDVFSDVQENRRRSRTERKRGSVLNFI
jgi:tetratricopeptide (TPR) repeat protein